MGARLGFADVLLSKLADVPPPLVLGRLAPRIASPDWVHRLEPLCAISSTFLHTRYPHPASAAPAAGGIPVENAQGSRCGGSQASSGRIARPRLAPVRTRRERLAIALLIRLGATLTHGATDDEIRRAYRGLLRQSHPDMHPQATTAEHEAHARTLRAVIGAWDVFQGRGSSLCS